MSQSYHPNFRNLVADTFLHTELNLGQVGNMYGVTGASVRNWAIIRNPDLYELATGRTRALLAAQDVVAVLDEIRVGELATLVGVGRSTIDAWVRKGLLDLDLACAICGEQTTTKYCRACVEKGWPRYVREYGLSLSQLRALPKRCEICGSSEMLHIDHCHTSGKYRGVLCHHCNVGLGHFKDNRETLRNAIKYLKSK